jgi:hypothetical protein
MSRRLLFMVVVAVCVTGLSGLAAASQPTVSSPSGERIIGGSGSNGGTVVEPAYDDMTAGVIRYVSTPTGTDHPVPTNPRATAPFYLPVYPVGSLPTTGPNAVTLNCQHLPENCPDHGPAVAHLAQVFEPGVYGKPNTGATGVIGHDHLMAGPGSGGDFNVAWVPILVLFTNSAAANTHITTLTQLNAMFANGDVIEVPLDGTPFGGVPLPNRTFHCSVVSAAVYAQGVPFTG